MTDLTFSMPDGREEKTNKQTNRQTNLARYVQEKSDASPQQYRMF